MNYRRWLNIVAVVAALVIVALLAIPVLAPDDAEDEIIPTPTLEIAPTATEEPEVETSNADDEEDTEDADGDVLFSPDGRWSVVVGGSDLLWLFDGTGEPQRPLADSTPEDLERPAAFSDNLLAVARGSQVHVWDLDTGEGFDLTPVDAPQLSLLAVGPDDDVVAAYACHEETDAGCGNGVILLWALEDGSLRHELDVRLATIKTLELETGDVLAATGCEVPDCEEPTILLWNTVTGSPIDMVETPAN
jgi:WD40 repeat protein